MYRGFQYEATKDNLEYRGIAEKMFDKHVLDISKSLGNYLQNNNALNATEMMDDWFPQIHCPVFISHAHADINKALTLAGKLKYHLKLDSFVDFCVWGYADHLLKLIDNKYCYDKANKVYRYEDRNFSTSHIHMMLASSLAMMIDKAECIFFLNTPNSLSLRNIKSKTMSPWIYHELAVCNLIRKQPPERHKLKRIEEQYIEVKKAEEMVFEYDVDLSKLTKVKEADISRWIKECQRREIESLDALDDWYETHPLHTDY